VTSFGNIVRIASILAYAVIMIMTVWVILTYYDAYRKQRDAWEGLLPHHVWVIGISYLLYGAVAAGWSVAHFGDTINLGSIAGMFGGLVGLYGMKLVLNFEKRRAG